MTLGVHNDTLQRWKRRRAYTDAGIRQIQNITQGDIVHEEVGGLIRFLSTLSEPADIRDDVMLTAARVMYRLTYGRRPDKIAVDGLRRMVHTMPDYSTANGSLSWIDLFPAWRLLRRSVLAKFVRFNRFMVDFCRREKRRSLDELGNDDDDGGTSLPASLFEFFRCKLSRMSKDVRDRYALNEDVMFDGLEEILRAGSESAFIAQWLLLYIAAFPQVQRQMRRELEDGGVARGSPLTVDDVLRSLPYCRAAFAEACRFSSINPFLKLELTDDIEFDGLELPRGTVLLFNSWAINNDRRNWSDPELFRPERFLAQDGTFDEDKMTMLVLFGFGKRRCIGVETGRALYLLIVVSVVQHFDVTLDSGQPDFDPVFGIAMAPRPYRLRLDLRS